MPRYFIEVSYKGTNYAGVQIQQNANSVQAEIEKALEIYFRNQFELTCSSRTDAGVHALKNYFHFNSDILPGADSLKRIVYNLNAILPFDIVVKRIFQVADNSHCRFDTVSREYKYFIYSDKNPFLSDRAFYYPYKLDLNLLQEAAQVIIQHTDFTSFSKRNTQVKTFMCNIIRSNWIKEENQIVYNVVANRFLRGMVRGLVGTMLKVGTGKITIDEFIKVVKSKDCSNADFSVPPQGLFLINVSYSEI